MKVTPYRKYSILKHSEYEVQRDIPFVWTFLHADVTASGGNLRANTFRQRIRACWQREIQRVLEAGNPLLAPLDKRVTLLEVEGGKMILCIGELHESPRTVTSTFASTLRAAICTRSLSANAKRVAKDSIGE